VIDYHPLTGNAALAANSSGYRELAEDEGFIVAYPEPTSLRVVR
jgi:poly(3-hydroxybutyrate) depolymerase